LRAGLHNVGYGVTYEGGTTGDGVLYELKSDGTFVLLHNFNLAAAGNAAGANPTNIVVGSSGIIYGSTQNGGGAIDCGPDGGEGCGVIFAYDPATGVYRVLHAFMESDGAFPTLGSIGADGTLYGSTSGGGPVRAGTLFSLSTSGPNPLFSSLYSFMDTTDGIDPQAGPTLEPDGSLIGTTNAGTAGTLYQFAHGTLTTLHDFGSPASDGTIPQAQPILSATGSIIGATLHGGLVPCTVAGTSNQFGCGTIYSYTP
jgi:uncharacterized repeat protein (TIGR03803 family)